MKYQIRTMKRMIEPVDGQQFASRIHVEIDNEGAAEYLKCTNDDFPDYEFYIEPAQWPTLRRLINQMIKECKE